MPYLGRREANGSCSTMQAGSSRFLYRIGIELYSVVCIQLQTCHYAPAHIVGTSDCIGPQSPVINSASHACSDFGMAPSSSILRLMDPSLTSNTTAAIVSLNRQIVVTSTRGGGV